MKLVYNWRILPRPVPSDQPLRNFIQLPARNPINELLVNDSIVTTATCLNLHSPLVPILFGYRIYEGEQYHIDVEARIEKKGLRVLQKRHEENSFLYLLVRVVDHQLYDTPFELQLFIKYGLPQSAQLLKCIKTSEVSRFVRLLSTRETTLHSQFIYEKIKKELCVQEPLEVLCKVGEGYLLFSLTNKEEQTCTSEQDSEQLSPRKVLLAEESFELSPKKQLKAPASNSQVVVESIELMSWLATGRHMSIVRKLPLAYTNESFKLAPEQTYNVLLRVDLVSREVHIPYLVKWRWDYSPEVFGMLKYIVLEQHQ